MSLQHITLIVTVEDPEDDVSATLDAIAATMVLVPFQVLLAGNGVPIDPAIMAGRSFSATIVQSAARISPAALLNGVLEHAQGDVVTILPAGVRPEPWWTVGVFGLLERADVALAAPRLVELDGRRIVSSGIVIGDGRLVARHCGLDRDTMSALEPTALFFAPIVGLSARRELFARVGSFDAGFEATLFDLDWSMRVRTQAGAIVYRPDITMRTDRPLAVGAGSHSRADALRFLERWQPTLGTLLDSARFAE